MHSSAETPRLVLASASPRRHALLSALGIPFEIVTSRVDESGIQAPTPREFALRAAREKCVEVAGRVGAVAVVIGADTVVCFAPDDPLTGTGSGVSARGPEFSSLVHSGMLGKPSNPREAKAMLRLLSGRTHTVVTAVAVRKPDGCLQADSETSAVTFRDLSEEQISEYVATGEPLDKAGAYGAQDRGRELIERVDGDLQNVIGLPLKLVARMLSDVYPNLREP